MPSGYEQTQLWRDSLASRRADPAEQARERLRVAYHGLRDRAAVLAGEIPQDLRDFTVHDITHSDALWELADQIAGPGISLTPTEAFVLGGAFLIHDLGMALAALPGGMATLLETPDWPDILATCRAEHPGRSTDQTLDAAKEIALRENHANHAEQLALRSWSAGGTEFHLIDNPELRVQYGELIGGIAASHGWDLDKVAKRFGTPAVCPSGDMPAGWTIDALKLACLLRLADIAHLDDRRAPRFLRAIRQPRGVSERHWIFQEKMSRARRDRDRLIFSSTQSFPRSEAAAWWQCFEAVQSVDRELHAVDALLTDRNDPRFAARIVMGADSPLRLRDLVRTAGWTPVDARVTVSNVPALARKLGGENLYGDRPRVALRELIQNASDASRALRSITGRRPEPIRVALRKESDGWWLDVSDSGIGMSQAVMVGPLLDFGRTYWGSQLMRQELPGLRTSSFRSTGQFGIGFYAVFMLGDQVRVISHRYGEASADTRVLEFEDGLDGRPILRPAVRSEQSDFGGGTTVSVRLAKNPTEPGGLLHQHQTDALDLAALVTWLAPALDCDVRVVSDLGQEQTVGYADDWQEMSAEQFLLRLAHGGYGADVTQDFPSALLNSAVRNIVRDGEVIARATLLPDYIVPFPPDNTGPGVLVTGGLRLQEITGIMGVFTGTPRQVDRDRGVVCASPAELEQWATEQAVIWKNELNRCYPGYVEAVAFLAYLGADIGDLCVCATREGPMTPTELSDWVASRDEVTLVFAGNLHLENKRGKSTFVHYYRSSRRVRLAENVVVCDRYPGHFDQQLWRRVNGPGMHEIISRAVARGWNLDPHDVPKLTSDDDGPREVVGHYLDNGGEFYANDPDDPTRVRAVRWLRN